MRTAGLFGRGQEQDGGRSLRRISLAQLGTSPVVEQDNKAERYVFMLHTVFLGGAVAARSGRNIT